MNVLEKLLDIENLYVDYKVADGYLSAVEDVSININKGEIFALVGESGCGKSTIAYTIMNLLSNNNEKVRGSINFKDKNLLELSEKQMSDIRGKEIGMIFQNPLDSLNPVYKTGYQIYEAIALDKIDKKEAWNRVIKLYEDVKIPDSTKRIESFPHELSGGMRQRIMIAMMLSRNPELLIADEPTTALDVTIEAQILEIIKDLKKEFNTSILVITHNFGVVAEIADKIGVMYAGKLVEQGDVFQIFKNPTHPYTKALLKALPRIRKHEGRLETIPGNVPKLVGEIKGCRFANRCSEAKEICFKEAPPQREIEKNHFCLCHLEVK